MLGQFSGFLVGTKPFCQNLSDVILIVLRLLWAVAGSILTSPMIKVPLSKVLNQYVCVCGNTHTY